MFDILEHTILATRAGSRAYGINKPDSDVDIKGVIIPPREYVLGLEVFEQADKPEHMHPFLDYLTEAERDIVLVSKLEGSLYELRKCTRMLADCNPNILDIIFCRDEDIIFNTLLGRMLRDNANIFLSQRANYSYRGYAVGQMKRILTHQKYLRNPILVEPTRESFGLPNTTLIPADQLAAAEAAIKKQLDSWEVDLSSVQNDSERIRIMERMETTMREVLAADSTAKFRDSRRQAAIVACGLSDNIIFQLEKERKYKSAHDEWKSYQKWLAERNKDRASLEAKYGYDTKHGAHLVRLMRMCEEILTTGKVNVWRGDRDADELRAIRNGAWSFEQISEFSETMDAKLLALTKTQCVLPKTPDRKKINELVVRMMRAAL